MRVRRRSNILVEPPSAATGDIAFNLIVFFLVCASTQPEGGRHQSIPSSEQTQKQQQEQKNIEVWIKADAVLLNGDVIRDEEIQPRLQSLLSGKTSPDDRIVVVKSDKATTYQQWMTVTSQIEEAGGVVTLQLEEVQQVMVE